MTYTVKAGDTLYGISQQFGVSAMDIYNLNKLSSTTIGVGQQLLIPTNLGTNPASYFTYTVKKGDSLYSIARIYNTTVQDIIDLNHLKSTALSIGQQLRIPESGESVSSLPSFVNYTVKKGDSLYSIARKYNVSVDTLVQDNALNSTLLSIGQNLKIRTSGGQMVVEECFGDQYVPDKETIYTVQKGDSLYSIAKKFNTDVATIKSKNNLTSNLLSIGQKLKI